MELLTLYLLILYWQFIMYQLFKALKYMHSAELIHRDIKVFNKLNPSHQN
jgi:serine/threonine protein kinase